MSELSIEQALREADRCVKCGLCLPHCPTYRLYADENESPRGRIALAEGLLRGQLDKAPHLVDHLYRCLMCRRCETVCPSGVRYTRLLDAARAEAPQSHWATRFTNGSRTSRLLSRAARATRLPGNTLSAVAGALPTSQPPAPGRYPARGELRGKVGLFLGCATSLYQGNALNAAVDLLTGLGYAVVIPSKQACCGALAKHQGDQETAQRLIDANREAFSTLDTVIGIASGCTVQLVETMGTQRKVVDIVTFLHQALAAKPFDIPRLEACAALHLPCTAVNALGNAQENRKLLQRIPGLELHPIGEAGDCCGAAGDHLLTQRRQAETLRQPLLDELIELGPRYLLTSNIGCALHLAEGARKAGVPLEVLHPVELLARQLT